MSSQPDVESTAALPYAPPPYGGIPALPDGQPPSRPGRVLGIVGFGLSFFFLLDIAGLVLCIVALVKSRRAGHKNAFALAGLIISFVGIVFCAVILAALIPATMDLLQTCGRLGNGVHLVGNAIYTCTPFSASKTGS
jgi:asparagine N-glycosylation enzyme membrane subunit Stt3